MQHVSHIHINRWNFYRERARALAVNVIRRIGQTVVGLQIHAVPAVRKLNANIKLDGIVSFTQPAHLPDFAAIAIPVRA